MKSHWQNLLDIRQQRVTQAQKKLAAARAAETNCEAAGVQTQQCIEKLQQEMQRNGAVTEGKSVALDRVLAALQERQMLQQRIARQNEQLSRQQEALAEARRVRADKAANFLLMQSKQANVQELCRDEQRIAAQRAASVEEELVIEQWLANRLPG